MKKYNEWLWPTITFFVSMLITIASFYTIFNLQRGNSIDINEMSAERHSRLLQAIAVRDIDHISSVANFFQSTEPGDWHQFKDFANHVLGQSGSLIALEWAPKVAPAQIESHMAKLRERQPDVYLYTSPESGVVAEGNIFDNDRALFVISDVVPFTKRNQQIVGFYPSRERIKKVEEFVTASHQAYVSDKVTLLQDDITDSPRTRSDGLLVYFPVFDKAGDNLIGLVIGVVRASGYIERMLSDAIHQLDVEIKIVDTGFGAGDNPNLYESRDWDAPAFYETSKFVYFPNRTMAIHYRFKDPIQRSDSIALYFVFIFGCIISVLITGIVYYGQRQQHYLEQELAKRTRDLNYLVDHDPQTSTYNRRAFSRIYDQYIVEKKPFGFLTFDIDNFKHINDKYGHPVGDKALQHVAKIVLSALEHDDKLFRVGGDEFNILSRKDSKELLKSYAEQIRQAVEKSPLNEETPVPITLSIGGAIWNNHEKEKLLYTADVQLYESKKRGKNASSIAGAD